MDLAEAWDRLAREAAVLWERMGVVGVGFGPAFCLKLCRRAAGSCISTKTWVGIVQMRHNSGAAACGKLCFLAVSEL